MITAEFDDGSINKDALVIIKFAGSNERNQSINYTEPQKN